VVYAVGEIGEFADAGFGEEDEIAVLTHTRFGAGEEASVVQVAPAA
jgi:hypothetical protein